MTSRPVRSTIRLSLPSLVAAFFGLAGAAIGGWFTYQATVRTQEADARRGVEREDAAARGAARVLIDELEGAKVYLISTLQQTRTLPVDDDARVALAPTDSHLLASRLTAREWVELRYTRQEAKGAVTLIRAVDSDAHVSTTGGGVRVPRGVLSLIDKTCSQIDDGQRALARLAGLPVAQGNKFGPPQH
jgi:hypothetical protein